jgi:S-adenosylmethionine hydrolase
MENTRAAKTPDGSWEGHVLLADRFGNLLTNFRSRDFASKISNWKLEVAGTTITVFHTNYAAGAPDEPFAIFGSSGLLEIAVNRGSAAQLLGLSSGAVVRLSPKNPAARNA